MKKLVFLLMFLGLMACTQAAEMDYFGNDIFYKGDVLIEIENRTYDAGESLLANISVVNMEEFPLVDGYLVIEVVKGGAEHVYPSQASDVDNVFHEEVISGLSLPPLTKRKIEYAYLIPSDLGSGTYRLEAYFLSPRTPVVGMAHIFISPQYVVFQAEGKGQFPYANIARTKTFFGNMTGPVGTEAKGSSSMKAQVVVRSSSATELSGLVLTLTVCDWDDTACSPDAVLFTRQYDIPVIAPGASVEVDADVAVPGRPGAYAVRMVVEDEAGRMISLYRSRIIVTGETARIRKMAVDKTHYNAKEKGAIKLLIGPSPDHYTLPVVKNAKVTVSIKESGREVFSKSETVPEISAAQGFIYKTFGFTAPAELTVFEICSSIDSGEGVNYDKYCFTVDPSKTLATENRISVRWDYDDENGVIEVNMCAEDAASGTASSVLASVILSTEDAKAVVASYGDLSLSPCTKLSIKADPGAYALLVNDVSSGRQTRYVVDLEDKRDTPPAVVCGDGFCDAGEELSGCCVDCGCADGGLCSDGVCVQSAQPAGCGNGKCDAGETQAACCVDCGCAQGGKCSNGACSGTEAPVNIYSIVLILIIIILLALFMYKKPKISNGVKK